MTNIKRKIEELRKRLNERIPHDLVERKVDGDEAKELILQANKDGTVNELSGMVVTGDLNFRFNKDIEELPPDLTVEGNLDLVDSSIRNIPGSLEVGGSMEVDNASGLTELPDSLKVGRHLSLFRTIREIPRNLEVGGNLELDFNMGLDDVPPSAEIGGRITRIGKRGGMEVLRERKIEQVRSRLTEVNIEGLKNSLISRGERYGADVSLRADSQSEIVGQIGTEYMVRVAKESGSYRLEISDISPDVKRRSNRPGQRRTATTSSIVDEVFSSESDLLDRFSEFLERMT